MRSIHWLAAASLLVAALPMQAQTVVTDAWVRGTVAQQKATGLFARITSARGGRLVAVSSPVAGLVEIHSMTMDGNVMRMRPLDQGLELPAGRPVELAPGGFHVMLMELKQALKAGETVPVSWVIEGPDRQREVVETVVPVRPLGAAPMPHKR